MKRLLSVFLVFLLTLTVLSPALAQENVSKTETLNEYEYIKALKQKSDNELKAEGFTEEKIKELKDFDYGKALKERAKLDKKTLENMGYSEKQIKELKSFNGTEEEIIALAATVSLTVQHNSFFYDSAADRSYWKVYFYWSWSSEPFWILTDIIGAGWTPTMSLMTSTSDSYHKVAYKNKATGSMYTLTNAFKLSNTNCGDSTFKMSYPTQTSYDWATNGWGYVKTSAGGRLRDMQMRISYGHTQLSGSSPTLSAPWGISFTFSSGVNQEASQTIQYYY